jgi:ABC-type polysaccharide/polyol phosphate transport system ATPase subunit
LSDGPAVRLNRVTKEFRLGGTAQLGLKNLLLRSPEVGHLRRRVRVEALRDVSFEIARGEWVAMIGPNGSGKSTMLGLIAGVLHPTYGTVETHGRISPLLELGAGFHPELTGAENVLLNGVILGLTRAMVRERFNKIVEFSGLGDEIDRPVRTYSSGMSARLGFSVAAHVDPEILLVDEVLAVGDEAFARRCLDKLQSFHAAGVTIVVVSHTLTLVETLCDRALLLVGGKLAAAGPPAEVIATYRSGIAG